MRYSNDPEVLSNARIVTPDDEFLGTLTMQDGTIVDVARTSATSGAVSGDVDCEGDYVLPGFVDIHTDNLEKHAVPRAGVIWHLQTAVCSHDAAMVAAGSTTVFDSLVAGGVGNAARRDLLLPAVQALNRAAELQLLRADHFLHVRCDIVERNSIRLVEDLLSDPKLRFVTFIDDQPDRDPGRAAFVHERRRGLPRGTLALPIAPTPEEDFIGAEERRRRIVGWCTQRGIPVANHDDTKAVHVADAHRLGMSIAEFPITMEAAVAAKECGMAVICGAPNLVRGGSHTGNVAVGDLVRAGIIEMLCSDYVPGSLLQAVFILASDAFGWSLPDAVGLATHRPATRFGLNDRGCIAVGRRADLVRVRMRDGAPAVHTVWREGHAVLGPGPVARQHARASVAQRVAQGVGR